MKTKLPLTLVFVSLSSWATESQVFRIECSEASRPGQNYFSALINKRPQGLDRWSEASLGYKFAFTNLTCHGWDISHMGCLGYWFDDPRTENIAEVLFKQDKASGEIRAQVAVKPYKVELDLVCEMKAIEAQKD